MEYRRAGETLYLRIDKGEEVMETIREVCRREGIGGGSFHGIGACDKAILSTWIEAASDFIFHTKEGMLEMVSLMGNISLDGEGTPFLHAHGIFSFVGEDGEVAVVAGHLLEAHISYTGEIILHAPPFSIGRSFDERAGIEVWALPGPSGAVQGQ